MRIALVLLTACTTTNLSAPIGDAPLEIHRGSSGTRFAVDVQIGDTEPFLAMLDTGSSGLRVLPGVADFAQTSSTLVSFSYHSGLAIAGTVATDTVTIAGLTTPPIPIMQIDQVGCTEVKPDCDAAGVSAADYEMFGYKAVLGIGMRNLAGNDGIGNPIAQLAGTPAFEVDAPSFDGDTGVLRIAPSEARYTTVALPAIENGIPLESGAPAWDDRAIPTCVGSFCSGGMFDSGCEYTELMSPSHIGDDVTWAPGTSATIAMTGLGGWAVTVGSPPVAGIDKIVEQTRTGSTEDLINLGTAVFFRYDVLFDQARGLIGLAAK